MTGNAKPRLLVVELWGLGDLVIATPFIRAAVERFDVTLLAKPFAEEMQPRLWPGIQVISFTAPWTAFRFADKYASWRWPWMEMSRLRRGLRTPPFDYAVSARWDPRDHFLLKLIGAHERFGFARWRSDRCLTRSLPRPDPLAHRSEYWRVLGEALGLAVPARDQFQPPERKPSPVAFIHSGARLSARVWPLAKFHQVAQRLRSEKIPVRIACDPGQLEWWREHGEKATSPRNVGELLVLLDGAGIFIGNCSGPGHLAAVTGIPTFTIYGPSLHEWWAPLHPDAEWIEGKGCPYKPCSDYCRFETPFCLWEVQVEDVWARLQAFAARHLSQPAGNGVVQLEGRYKD